MRYDRILDVWAVQCHQMKYYLMHSWVHARKFHIFWAGTLLKRYENSRSIPINIWEIRVFSYHILEVHETLSWGTHLQYAIFWNSVRSLIYCPYCVLELDVLRYKCLFAKYVWRSVFFCTNTTMLTRVQSVAYVSWWNIRRDRCEDFGNPYLFGECCPLDLGNLFYVYEIVNWNKFFKCLACV